MNSNDILQANEPADAPHHLAPNLRQRILVVEDDPSICWLNTEMLTCFGYQVDASEDGEAAWHALQQKKYDLMVTDNDMPKVTGVELIQKIQAASMALPVIMATGTLPGEEFARARSLQPAKTLLKPYTFDELLAAVKEVLWAASDSLDEITPPPNWQVRPMPDRLQF